METTEPGVTITSITQESFDSFVQAQTISNQMNIIGLAIIAGCIIASVVLRYFHND